MAGRTLVFEYLSPGCWVTPDWSLLLEKLPDGWSVKEPARTIKRGFPSKSEARAWAQDWIDGKVHP